MMTIFIDMVEHVNLLDRSRPEEALHPARMLRDRAFRRSSANRW